MWLKRISKYYKHWIMNQLITSTSVDDILILIREVLWFHTVMNRVSIQKQIVMYLFTAIIIQFDYFMDIHILHSSMRIYINYYNLCWIIAYVYQLYCDWTSSWWWYIILFIIDSSNNHTFYPLHHQKMNHLWDNPLD